MKKNFVYFARFLKRIIGLNPNMPMMFGVVVGVMLLLAPSIGVADEQHSFEFNYSSLNDTGWLCNAFGNYCWDDATFKYGGNDCQDCSYFSPLSFSGAPWKISLKLSRIQNNSTNGGYVSLSTNTDSPVSGNFKYKADFMLYSLPSDHGETVTRNYKNGGRAWYCEIGRAACRERG